MQSQSSAGFTLSERLQNDTFYIGELALCKVLLMNNAYYPWLILVPKRADMREIIDLSGSDQLQLLNEIRHVSHYLRDEFQSDKLNVAALGNVEPQLHVHVIVRYTDDMAWPQPVWGKGALSYAPDIKEIMLGRLRGLFAT